jgi:hypothetical protein
MVLDGFDRVRDRPQPLVGDGGIERRQIDRPYRLGAEHKRIEAHAIAVDAHLLRERAESIETLLGLGRDAAVEQMHSRQIAGILQRLAQRDDAATAARVILWRPAPRDGPADRGANDRLVRSTCWAQPVLQRRRVGQRLDPEPAALRLSGGVELAQRTGKVGIAGKRRSCCRAPRPLPPPSGAHPQLRPGLGLLERSLVGLSIQLCQQLPEF